MSSEANGSSEQELESANKAFYEPLWASAELVSPTLFNTWPLVSELATDNSVLLEVAPGLRPRFPLPNTQFLDLSSVAVQRLQAAGAQARQGSINDLPFADDAFTAVCAFDVVEHVDDDEQALSELARVLKPDGQLLVSVPLYMEQWSEFDRIVGHRRRYEPEQLLELFSKHGFTVEQSAAYGMRPKSNFWSMFGLWFLRNYHAFAMRWYNRVFKYTVRWQKPLQLQDGMIRDPDVVELLLLCRYSPEKR